MSSWRSSVASRRRRECTARFSAHAWIAAHGASPLVLVLSACILGGLAYFSYAVCVIFIVPSLADHRARHADRPVLVLLIQSVSMGELQRAHPPRPLHVYQLHARHAVHQPLSPNDGDEARRACPDQHRDHRGLEPHRDRRRHGDRRRRGPSSLTPPNGASSSRSACALGRASPSD